MMRDLFSNVTPRRCIAPAAAKTDNTAWVGQVVGHAGYQSVTRLIALGDLADADATFTVLLEHGDLANGTDMAAVPDEFLLGTEALAGFTFAHDNALRKLGYVGPKAYTRLTITPANNTGNAFVSSICLLGHPQLKPTVNPPA